MFGFCFSDVDQIVRESQKVNVGASTSGYSGDVVKPRRVRIFKPPEVESAVESASKKKFAPMSRMKIR